MSKQNCIRDLARVEWSPVYNDKNPDSSFKSFLDTYKELHDKNFPLETLAKKSKQNPWLQKELNKIRKTRNKNRKKVNQGPLDEKEYQKQKNQARKITRKAQEKELFDEKQNGKKQMWKHLGSILNPKRINGPQSILRLFANNCSITENSTEK